MRLNVSFFPLRGLSLHEQYLVMFAPRIPVCRKCIVHGKNVRVWKLDPHCCREKLRASHALGTPFQLGRSTLVTVDGPEPQRDVGDADVFCWSVVSTVNLPGCPRIK